MSAPAGTSALAAGGLGCSPFPGAGETCRGALGDAGDESSLACRSMVIAKFAEPSITIPSGIIFSVELTNAVVSLWPALSSTSRRLDGRCGIAVRPIATPSGLRMSCT